MPGLERVLAIFGTYQIGHHMNLAQPCPSIGQPPPPGAGGSRGLRCSSGIQHRADRDAPQAER
jgi:hypothetical protein